MLIHPYKSEAVSFLTEKTISYWDISKDEAILLRTEPTGWQRIMPASSESFFGTLYSESPKNASEFVYAPCFWELRNWDDYQVVELFPVRSLVEKNWAVWLQSLGFSPDGKWIAIAGFVEVLYILERPQNKVVAELDMGLFIPRCVFDEKSHRLAAYCTGQGYGHISVYEIENGVVTVLHEALPGKEDCYGASMQFNTAGNLLAVWECWGQVKLFEVTSGQLLWTTDVDWDEGENSIPATDIVFSRNETEIIVGGDAGSILILDAQTGQIKQRIQTSITGFTYHIALDRRLNRLWAIGNAQSPVSVDLSAL